MSAIGDLAKEYVDYDDQVIIRIECSARELRAVEKLESELASMRKELEEANVDLKRHMGYLDTAESIYDRERERAECLQAENAKLKADAERYRLLRSMQGTAVMCGHYYGERLDAECDAAIDAAREVKP